MLNPLVAIFHERFKAGVLSKQNIYIGRIHLGIALCKDALGEIIN